DQAVARTFDDVAGEALVEREVGDARLLFFLGGAEMLGDGCDVKLMDGGALLLGLPAPVRRNVAKERGAGMIGRNVRGRMREEKIFGEAALVFGDRSEALDFLGVDDGEV